MAMRDGNGQGRRESCRGGTRSGMGQHCVSFLAGPGQALRIWNGTSTGKMCIWKILWLCVENGQKVRKRKIVRSLLRSKHGVNAEGLSKYSQPQ